MTVRHREDQPLYGRAGGTRDLHLPVEAIREALAYFEINPEVIALDHITEMYLLSLEGGPGKKFLWGNALACPPALGKPKPCPHDNPPSAFFTNVQVLRTGAMNLKQLHAEEYLEPLFRPSPLVVDL